MLVLLADADNTAHIDSPAWVTTGSKCRGLPARGIQACAWHVLVMEAVPLGRMFCNCLDLILCVCALHVLTTGLDARFFTGVCVAAALGACA